jgi:hypothetical protein
MIQNSREIPFVENDRKRLVSVAEAFRRIMMRMLPAEPGLPNRGN